MKYYYNKDKIEAGVDEAGRGSLFGRIYAAAVIFPKEKRETVEELMINDSKKLTKKKKRITL